jgi:serine/threonine protein phosphatase 1
MNRRIFIGDVHGHYDGLMHLFEAIAPGTGDEIYFLGDLIDRGPKSAQVVQFVRHGGYRCILGNHEQLVLLALPSGDINENALQAWIYSGGQATLDSYDQEDQLFEDAEWFKTLPYYFDLGDIWLVHAGVHPRMPLAEQTGREFCWIREEFLNSPKPYFPDKLIIFGHTITFTLPGVEPGALARGPGWLGIDTGAYHPRSGWLTALDITHQKVHQVNVLYKTQRSLPLEEAIIQVEPVRANRQEALGA